MQLWPAQGYVLRKGVAYARPFDFKMFFSASPFVCFPLRLDVFPVGELAMTGNKKPGSCPVSRWHGNGLEPLTCAWQSLGVAPSAPAHLQTSMRSLHSYQIHRWRHLSVPPGMSLRSSGPPNFLFSVVAEKSVRTRAYAGDGYENLSTICALHAKLCVGARVRVPFALRDAQRLACGFQVKQANIMVRLQEGQL